ncbi:MAG TPA: class I SAM-dependent methyltransferase [Candidatus Binataceae bacterium]|nr:class I SAM-dependent methyltransferase [Candidatus Binataceae bacterium]
MIHPITAQVDADDISERSGRQRHFYDEECDPEFEIARPHDCGRVYEYLIETKFRTAVGLLSFPLAGRTVLEICAGSGMMAEKFARAGATVTATDFSPAAIVRASERARRYGFTVRLMAADAERLPFSDRSFDIVAVHDGLHHLEHPGRAIREMARVARQAVLIMDPARAALTRLAVRLNIAEDVEEAGNEVKRLAPREVASVLKECGFGEVAWRRTLMYYPHRPWRWLGVFDNAPMYFGFRVAFGVANLGLGRWGNKLSLVGRRIR